MSLCTLNRRIMDDFQTHAQHITGVARVNDPIVQQDRRRPIALAVSLHAIPEPIDAGINVFRLQFDPLGLCTVGLDGSHHAGQLVGTHDAASANGPGEEESRLIGAAAHGIVSCAVGSAQDDRNVRHGRAADGGHELRALLDDARVLGLGADHESGHVVQEDDGRALLVTQADKVGALGRFVGVDHGRLIRNDGRRHAHDARECRDQVTAVFGFEEQEARVVYDPEQDFSHVEWFADIRVH